MTGKSSSKPTAALIALILILVAGSALRIFDLDARSVWDDELATWYQSSRGSAGEVLDEMRHDVHPPGYSLFLHFVQKAFGDSELALRLPSVVFGIASIIAIFRLGAVLFTPLEGLFAAAFMAVLWAPIAYSQEARPYSALLLFSLLSMYYWLSILFRIGPQRLHPRWSLIAYLCSSVICAYVHFFGLYLLLLQTIFTAAAMALRPRDAKRLSSLIAVNILAVCLFLPWFLVTLDKLVMQDFWIPRPTLFAFVEFLGFLFNRCTNLCAWQSTSYDLLYVVLPLYLGLFVREGWSFLKRGERQESEVSEPLCCLVLVLWLVVPFLGAFLKSIYFTPILTERNLIISLPAAYLLLARSITVLFQNARLRVAVVLVLVALFAGHLVVRVKYYRTECKPQYREAVAFILANENKFPDSLIVGCSGQRHPLELLNYYFQRLGSPERAKLLVCEKDDIAKLEREITAKKPKFVWWLVAGVRQPDGSLPQTLEKRLTLLHYQRFFGAHVLLFRVPSTEENAGKGSRDRNTQSK